MIVVPGGRPCWRQSLEPATVWEKLLQEFPDCGPHSPSETSTHTWQHKKPASKHLPSKINQPNQSTTCYILLHLPGWSRFEPCEAFFATKASCAKKSPERRQSPCHGLFSSSGQTPSTALLTNSQSIVQRKCWKSSVSIFFIANKHAQRLPTNRSPLAHPLHLFGDLVQWPPIKVQADQWQSQILASLKKPNHFEANTQKDKEPKRENVHEKPENQGASLFAVWPSPSHSLLHILKTQSM